MTSNYICRVCLEACEQDDNIQSIFQCDLNDCSDSIKIFIKICECSGILIDEDDDHLTNIICDNCMNDLKVAYNFRKRCQISDNKLKANIKIEDQINEKAIKYELINLFESIKTDSITESTIKNVENNLELNYENCNDIKCELPQNLISVENNSKKHQEKNAKLKAPIKNLKRKNKEQNISTSGKKIKDICLSKPKCEEKFPCEYCGNIYSDKITLRYHMRKHTNEIHYVCELCGIAVETNYKLTRHKMIHSGEKPYSCRFCERTFLHSSNRNLHEKRLHTHIRNHQCEYCVKAFHTPCQLRKHIRVHTGEKPYICELCGTGFKAKSHLTAHMHSLVPCVVKLHLKNKIENQK